MLIVAVAQCRVLSADCSCCRVLIVECAGCLLRLLQIYIFTEEMKNMLSVIRSLFSLDPKSTTVNTCVSKLQQLFENNAVQELCQPPEQPPAASQTPAGPAVSTTNEAHKPWRGDFGWR